MPAANVRPRPRPSSSSRPRAERPLVGWPIRLPE
jgi:hypothetical protein